MLCTRVIKTFSLSFDDSVLTCAERLDQGEIALLNHATDFLYFRIDILSYHRFFVANLADAMILIGFLLVVVTPTYQKIVVSTGNYGKLRKAPLRLIQRHRTEHEYHEYVEI